MQQVKAIFELRYSDVPNIYSYKRRLAEAITAQKQDKQPALIEVTEVLVQDQKARIIIEANRLAVSIEQAKPKQAADMFLTIYERAEPLLRLSKVDRAAIRSIWAEKSDLSFDELVSRHKSSFFTGSNLLNAAFDVSLPLTFKLDDYTVNFLTGPMEYAQLRTNLDHEVLGLDVSTIVDMDFFVQDVTVSRRWVKDFAKEVFDKQKHLLSDWGEAFDEEPQR